MSKPKKDNLKSQLKGHLILNLKKFIIFIIILLPLTGLLFFNNYGPWLDPLFSKPPHLSWNSDPQTSIGITWETPIPTDTIVRYGVTPDCKNTVSDSTFSMLHFINLTNLEPNTTYYYQVGCSFPFLPYMIFTYTFETAPAGTQPFKFAIISDTQQDAFDICQHDKVISSITVMNPDFLIHTGDIVADSGRLDQWNRIFYEMTFLTCNKPIMPCLGNHDYKYAWIAALPYLYYFNLPNNELFYSYNYSNAHFISLCVGYNDGLWSLIGNQREWLENDLEIASQSNEIDWIFVYFHAPMFSSGGFGMQPDLTVQFWDLFEKYNVDVIFNGHDHVYERMYIWGNPGIHNIVFGGGGGALDVQIGSNPWTVASTLSYGFGFVQVDNKTLTYQAINTEGQVIDWFTWSK